MEVASAKLATLAKIAAKLVIVEMVGHAQMIMVSVQMIAKMATSRPHVVRDAIAKMKKPV